MVRVTFTDAQKAEITPIVQKEMAELKVVRDDTSMRRMQKARRAKEINEAASAQIRALLTPEQQIKYDTLRAEGKAKRREQFQARRKERERGTAADD